MALAVINVVAAVVGVGLMIPSVIPEKDEAGTVVRIAAGLSSDEKDTTAGNQPGIGLYDVMGRRIGMTNGKKHKIKDGDYMDIKVPFDKGVGKKPTEYISVVDGGDDALCIAYIALTQPDGTKKAWYGDVGKACGADWYHSQLKTGEDDYQPACIWIDRNKSLGLRHQGLGLHIHDFAATKERAKQYDSDKDLMCKVAPRFRMYEKMNSDDPIPFFSPPLEYEPKTLVDADPKVVKDKKNWALPKDGPNVKKGDIHKRSTEKVRRQAHPEPFQSLIIDQSKGHSAKALCESKTSRGPDFVSVKEGLFCDMDAKKIWPVCNEKKTSGCFDVKAGTMRPGKGLQGRDVETGAIVPKKTYKKKKTWT